MKKLKHTKIGITAFIFMLILVIDVIIITIADIVFASPAGPMASKDTFISPLIRVLIADGIAFISFALGIAACFQKEAKKVLPAISIIISGLFLLPVIGGSIKLLLLYIF